MEIEKLTYSIYAFSSYSGLYTPEKILENNPEDQTSRWSSENNNPPQFLILRLESPAIVKSIKFGKFDRSHVCNLRRFDVFGSWNENGFIKLYSGGLRNDSTPETFNLKHKLNDRSFPCRFIKIVPLQSWAVSFNYSIWYIELLGDKRPSIVQGALEFLTLFKEKEALRLCLKFLRRSGYLDAFENLQLKSEVKVEHELVAKLYKSLVLERDYEKVEETVNLAIESGFFDAYIDKQAYKVDWMPVKVDHSLDETGNMADKVPGFRENHQMIIDDANGIIYLHGGSDGFELLADFWAFHLETELWTRISKDVLLEGGPSARSMHRMILDSKQNRIFCFGRYFSPKEAENNVKANFYVYSINENFWTQISEDTFDVGGPSSIFDHQLAINSSCDLIYCFGGCIVEKMKTDEKAISMKFSGLFSYNILTNTWKKLRVDDEDIFESNIEKIRGRSGHSMFFDEKSESLFIIGGQRGNEYLQDILLYNPSRDDLVNLVVESSILLAPISGFTQTATFDEESGSLFLSLGFYKDRVGSKKAYVQTSFYEYKIDRNDWKLIHTCGSLEYQPVCGGKNDVVSCKVEYLEAKKVYNSLQQQQKEICDIDQEPVPRFSHQIVFSARKKTFYLFGGNPGSDVDFRLDDFWQLKLNKMHKSQLDRLCKMSIRQCKFYDMLNKCDPIGALDHLQHKINPLFDILDKNETLQLHKLASEVFDPAFEKESEEAQQARRLELFEKLNGYFQDDFTEPKVDLVDLIQI